MKALQLRNIEKLYFGYEEIARTLNISLSSARVAVSRYVKAGFLIRLKRNVYVLHEKWAAMSLEQKFAIANLIQVPSYVSLMTALNYYEITTQLQQDFIESVAVKRSNEIEIENTIFHYVKTKPELYFGFTRTQGFFIADPEKAFVDALYLQSLGRHSLDVSSIDFQRLNRAKVFKFAKSFPQRTQRLVEKYEYSFKT
jgi:predicted transcriptional regulator of viral defense system